MNHNTTFIKPLQATFAFSFLFIWLFAPAQHSSISFNNLSLNEGLSQSSVVDITFDAKGFVWLATQDGLNRFDGSDFQMLDKKFDDLTSGSSSRLGKVAATVDDFLWLITKGGQLEMLDLTSSLFRSIPVISGNTNQVATCLLPLENGKLWVGTESGKLICYDSKKAKIIQEIHVPATTGSPAINALFKDSQQRLWIIGSTVSYMDRNKVRHTVNVEPGRSKQQTLFSSIAEDKQGNLWLGSWGRGLFLKKNTETSFNPFTGYGIQTLPSDLVIEALFADNTGNLWLGTYGKGLFVLDGKKEEVQQFVNDKRNPFTIAFNDVLSIKQDAANGIWIGTDGGGVSYYNEGLKKFVLFSDKTVPPNIEIAMVRSITTSKDGTIWAGTSNKGLTRINYSSDEYKTWHFPSYTKSIYNPDRIVSLFCDTEDIIWLGTQGNGIILFDPKVERVVKWFHPEAPAELRIPDGTVWCSYPESKDQLWIGTGSNGLGLINKRKGMIGIYAPTTKRNGFTDAIRSIIAIDDSTLCIGFEKTGILLFNTIHKSFYPIRTKALDSYFNTETTIKSLYYKKPLLWIGTDGRGLFTYDMETGKSWAMTEKDGLPNNTIYGILKDNEEALWVSTNKGLSRFKANIVGQKLQPSLFTNYTSLQGLQSNEFNTGAFHKASDGTLLFGGINGLNVFNPSTFKEGRKIIPVAFTKILVDNELVPQDTAAPYQKTVHLTSKNHSVAFSFAALDFFSSHQNHYYYKLEGYDSEWIDAEERNYVSYTNIPTGRYRFLITYAKPGTVHHSIANQLQVFITGPFWERPWFLMLLVLVVAAFVYLLYRYRITQFLKLQQVRQGIATDLHDDIGSTLSNINILSELSKKSLGTPTQAGAFLTRISEEVQASSQSLDDIIWSVNTHNDTWQETFSRMRRYAAEVFESGKTVYHLSLQEHGPMKKLAMEKRRDVFLIYKELINNIHRHAGATEVWIDMRFLQQNLVMEIRDNGRGFDKNSPTHRNGLKNLGSRVARWKGSLNIDTGKEGTRVQISI